MTEERIIGLDHVSFGYGEQMVVEDVDLSIHPLDYVCIIGPNGGGKTTLLKLILGLISPTQGTVRLFGKRPEESRSRLGYIPQNPHVDPLFPARALDVVLMGRLGGHSLVGPYRRADKEASRQALAKVGMADFCNRPFSALSGGQRQRVLIARALAAEPELLLMDEPTANLDRSAEREFYDLLGEFNQRLTIVMVSHDLGFVSQFVKTVVCVRRTVVVHPTSEITGEVVNALYGMDVRLVRHDHRCSEGGHEWPTS